MLVFSSPSLKRGSNTKELFLSLFHENVDLALHLKTERRGGLTLGAFSTTQILHDAGILPYASAAWGGAGPGGSGGRCWSGLGHLRHPRGPCWLCLRGRLLYRCCLVEEWPPVWRNDPHLSSCCPLADSLHRKTWPLERTPAGLGDTNNFLVKYTAQRIRA